MGVCSDAHKPVAASHLFTLRLWLEDLGGGQTDWRGKVQCVNSGEALYFRDWPTLEAFVERLLGRPLPEEAHAIHNGEVNA
jgi:hypothetical protein